MRPAEDKIKFVEMRARGLSLEKIAAELKVAPMALHRWDKQMRGEIDAKASEERERIISRFNVERNERLTRYCALYNRLSERMDKDYLDTIRAPSMLRMMLWLDERIAEGTAGATHRDSAE